MKKNSNNGKLTWKIIHKNISELKPFEKNPRKLTEKGMKDLGISIDKFGLAEPIVLNSDSTIIGGHARYYSLKQKNIPSADCYIPSRQLTEKEVKELNVRLNKNIAADKEIKCINRKFPFNKLFNEKETKAA